MHPRIAPAARPLAAALALGVLITTGAACSSSSKSASSTTSLSNASSNAKPGSTAVGGTAAPVTAAKSGGNSSDPNPCTIVTTAEVQAITGASASASPTGPTEANRGTNCTWHSGNGGSLLVQVYHGKAFYDPSMQAPKATKLTGMGDDAYLDAFGTTRVGVGFLKGDVAVFLDGLQVTSAEAVVAAARDAASKV